MSDRDIKNYLDFAHRLADAARSAIAPHFRSNIAADNKDIAGGFDPVTAGDRAAEAAMRALIAQDFPDHLIYGEEEGGSLSDSIPTWVLDPIDGTRAFISGLPVWGTLIGLDLGQGPVVGVMDQGFTGERYFAGPEGAYLSHMGETKRLTTRKTAGLAQAVVATTSPDLFTDPKEAQAFAHIRQMARMVRYGTDCYGYVMLASGFVDLVIESNLKAYDVQALIPIVTQAGGVMTTWSGRSARHGGQVVAAATPALHEAALAILATAAV
jgi:histidinol phosphatase-like enzyme (inositol monophosphatase family)